MKKHHSFRFSVIILYLLAFCMIFTGCSSSSKARNASFDEPPSFSTFQVLVPEAPAKKLLGSSPLTLDISNINQGYFVAQSDSADTQMNLQISTPTQTTYSYFISPGEQAVIPFSEGDGDYIITAYQQIEGDQYAALYSETVSITLDNEFLPFLYPNQYVNFSSESLAVQKAYSLVTVGETDLEILKEIYNFIIKNITYDYDKAESVSSGYLPNIDETLTSGTGICFDYAALTAAMLRSCDIPCKLQIGYSGDIKHAWIDVYIKSEGWIENAVSFDGDTWTLLDPTFESTSDDSEAIQEYIGDETNYTVQFTR